MLCAKIQLREKCCAESEISKKVNCSEMKPVSCLLQTTPVKESSNLIDLQLASECFTLMNSEKLNNFFVGTKRQTLTIFLKN